MKQQYSNNDSKQDIGAPTSHSTPLDENDSKSKAKKGLGKKTTKIYKKDVDFVEVNVPHTSDTNQAPSINVNLTKHISFNVEKDGGITVDNIKKDVNISPEKVCVETEVIPYLAMDKEIQTSLTKDKSTKDKSTSLDDTPKPVSNDNQKIPVMISLNTLRKRLRRKKSRVIRKRFRTKKKVEANIEITPQEKSGEQLSEAESFEYMPGHMYNQNQMKDNEQRPDNSTAGNKSSLESSGPLTTDSSKDSKHSLTKDLEKCIDLLKVTLKQRYDDGNTKKKLIKDIVHRLVNSKYRDDDTTTEFLSGLSFSSKKIGIQGNNTTTSTSDTNNTEDDKYKRPKKSILRTDKFNPNIVASTSQSAPNLFSASSEKVNTNLMRTLTSNAESDASSRGKTSSDNAFPKTSSEELYLKYLEAVRREEAYKRHLKDKEMFLKQKLVSSETAFKVPIRQESKISSRLKDLMKDLTRNNYDDGSGDASKLEGGSTSNMDFERFNAVRNQRSHSVFTLSSSHSECPKRPNLKKKMQAERELGEAGPSRDHYCCCPHHYINSKVGYADSSVQVNIKCQHEESESHEKQNPPKSKVCAIIPCECKKSKPQSSKLKPESEHKTESPRHQAESPKRKLESPRNAFCCDNVTGEIKYVCLCNRKPVSSTEMGDNFMVYKCSKLTNRGIQLEDCSTLYNTGVQCAYTINQKANKDDKIELIQPPCKMNTATESTSSDNTSNARRYSKSSQTNMLINMMCQGDDCNYSSGSEVKNLCGTSTKCIVGNVNVKIPVTIDEATRCLQTEISINPKIADPTLSDINIVNDYECAKLVAEQRRQLSTTSTEKSAQKTYTDVSTSSVSEKLIIKSEDNILREGRRSSKTSINDLKDALTEQTTMAVGNDYTVPIQGTNMMLRVNLGAVEINTKKNQVDQAVATEKAAIVDETTSVNEAYMKSSDHISNTSFTKPSDDFSRTSGLSKKYSPEKLPKSNTYPKNDPVKKKPPIKRCNTTTLAICSCVQTDFIKIKDSETNNNQKIVICENQPKTKVVTCENACQVEQSGKSYLRTQERVIDPTEEYDVSNEEQSVQTDKIDVGVQKDLTVEEIKTGKVEQTNKLNVETSQITTKCVGCETENNTKLEIGYCVGCQTDVQEKEKIQQDLSWQPKTNPSDCEPKDTLGNVQKDTCCSKDPCAKDCAKDPIIDLIQDITRRYSKKEIVKIRKKKCFTEIMTVLNYLLETEESTDPERKTCCSTTTDTKSSSDKSKMHKMSEGDCCSDKQVDKTVQRSCRKSRKDNKIGTESSDLPCSTDMPTTSSESAACRVLNKIKKECEKYHQKKCKVGRKCEVSSSTSVNCERCKKVHHCACKSHKCKRSKTFEKLQKKCIAYNLIIQTSESMMSEETVCEKKFRPLQNIIVKVPKRKDSGKKEATYKTEQVPPNMSPPYVKNNRSKSCPNESESTDEYSRKTQQATIREYLEQNRPDFVENTSQRQHCLKFISERR